MEREEMMDIATVEKKVANLQLDLFFILSSLFYTDKNAIESIACYSVSLKSRYN